MGIGTGIIIKKVKKMIKTISNVKKVFIAFAHPKYKSGESFNSCVRDEFIKSSKERNFEIDLMNIYEEKLLSFGMVSPPDNQILDIQNRMEKADIIFLYRPVIILQW